MATYEVEVVQLVYAVVKVEADDGESAIEACYEHPALRDIRPNEINIEPSDWVALADFVDENQGLTRDAKIEESVFEVEGYLMFGKNENYVDPSVDRDWADDGTMPKNVEDLADAVVGRKIVSAEIATIKQNNRWVEGRVEEALVLTLDNGAKYAISDSDDCCAYTELQSFIFNVERCDNIITDVATEDGYQKWHVLADFGDVLTLQVGWSCGNPFYYGYGFDIRKIEEVDGSLKFD